MAIVWIPSLMRDLTGGQTRIDVSGRTVKDVIDALDARYPGVKERLCDGARLDPTVAISVNNKVTRLGLRQPVGTVDEVRFLPVIEGG